MKDWNFAVLSQLMELGLSETATTGFDKGQW